MRIGKTFIAAAAAVSLVAVSVASTIAQDDSGPGRGWGMGNMMRGWGGGPMMGQGPGGYGYGWGNGPMMGQGPMGWGNGSMPGYGGDGYGFGDEARLAYLKNRLGIGADQTDAWGSFVEAVRSTAEAHGEEMYAMMSQMHDGSYFEMSFPERLALREGHMQNRVAEITAVREAAEALYETLDDEQKQAADNLLSELGMGGMMMGPGMMGPGMMGRGPGMMGPWMMYRWGQ